MNVRVLLQSAARQYSHNTREGDLFIVYDAIETERIVSQLVESHEKLLKALERSMQWHKGDKWRESLEASFHSLILIR